MNFDLTPRARTVLELARDEAIRLQHGYVGTEHVLLALIREGEGVAVAVMRDLGVDPDAVRANTEQAVRAGTPTIAIGELPFTSRTKKVLEHAMDTARELDHSYVGTEHLLLGLLCEEQSIAAHVLTSLGMSLAAAHTSMLRLTGDSAAPADEAG